MQVRRGATLRGRPGLGHPASRCRPLGQPACRRVYSRRTIGEEPLAGGWSPWSTSGSRSTPFGQAIVPATSSTNTAANSSGSRSDARTPQGAVGDGRQDLLPAVDGVERGWLWPPRYREGERVLDVGSRRGAKLLPAAEECVRPGTCWVWSSRGDVDLLSLDVERRSVRKPRWAYRRRDPGGVRQLPSTSLGRLPLSGVGRFYSVHQALVRKQSS